VFGVDLVEWQLRVAAGERLALPPPRGGHAIEARIYAEDPARGFLPAAGVLRALELPDGPQLRVDCAVAGGEAVGTRYDPMIAKLVAHAPTRAAALERLRGALRASTVLGVRSNVGFLAELLADPRVRAGELDTELAAAAAAARAGADAREDARAALAALVAQWDALDGADDTFARLRGWRIAAPAPPVMHALVLDGERPVEVGLAAGGAALVGGEPAAVELVSGAALAGGGRRLRIALDGVAEEWVLAREGDAWWVGHAGRAWRVAPDPRAGGGEEGVAGDELRAPMPGAIVDVRAREGAVVARGEVVLVMESMKMELQITAPRDGTLASLRVAAGDQVALDALLATLAERAA